MGKRWILVAFLALQKIAAVVVTVNDDSDSLMPTGSFNTSNLTGNLRGCLNYLNTVSDVANSVTFTAPLQITLSAPLPVLNLINSDPSATLSFNVSDKTITLDGAGQYQGFVAKQGTVSIVRVNFQNCVAQGGIGGSPGGGGGMGGGGAIASDAANIQLNTVSFNNCGAIGGAGGPKASNALQGGGGGGGMGGAGGAGGTGVSSCYGGGGGGGGLGLGTLSMPSSGGSGGSGGNFGIFSGGGGGGGGIQSQGGVGGADRSGSPGANGAGSGGGGVYTAGGNGSSNVAGSDGAGLALFSSTIVYGGGGGGTNLSTSRGGIGGGSTCSTGTTADGGSGGLQTTACPAPSTFMGGAGANGGGGGGGGGTSNSTSLLELSGGSAGLGGGGGGGGSANDCYVQGGAGGWGGGSGGAGTAIASVPSDFSLNPGGFSGGGGGGSAVVDGASGGFGGGGGGGGGLNSTVHGGISAFGGGSGGAYQDTADNTPPTGLGIGGGFGNGGGGGGAGLGGAIFMNTGTLTIGTGCSMANGSLQAGSGGSGGGHAGAIAGMGIFSRQGTINVSLNAGTNFDLNSQTIADGSAYSIQGVGFAGGDSTAVAVSIFCTTTGGATVNWNGANTYSGGTTLNTVMVTIISDQAFGLPTAPLTISGGVVTGLILGASGITMQRPILVQQTNSGAQFQINTNDFDLTTSGPLQFKGPATVKNGPGTWYYTAPLPSSNPYSGALSIQGGTFSLSGPGNLSAAKSVNLNGSTLGGAVFDISNLASASTQIQDLAGALGTVSLGNKELIFGTNRSTSFGGSIIAGGSGQLQKVGIGAVTFSGSSTIPGGVAISQGTLILSSSGSLTTTSGATISSILQVDGLLTGDATVNSGGLLRGTGTVSGLASIANNATIQAGDTGNGIGNLSIGQLSLSSSSHTNVSLNYLQDPSAPSSSAILVTGGSPTTINGDLNIFVNPAPYAPGATFTLLSAPAGLSGIFSNVNITNAQYLGPTATFSYLSTAVLLTILVPPPPQIDLSLLNGNENGQHVAEYLNGLATDPVLRPVVYNLSILSSDALNAAINSISPARNAIGAFVSQNVMFSIADVVSCRMAQQRLSMRAAQMGLASLESDFLKKAPPKSAYYLTSSSPQPLDGPWEGSASLFANWEVEDDGSYSELEPLASPKKSPYGSSQTFAREQNSVTFWIQGLAEFISQNAQDEDPSFSSFTAGGFLGWDYYGKENGLLGAAICYAKSYVDQSQNAGQNFVDYYAAALYGTAYFGDGYLEIGLAGALNRFHSQRFGEFVKANGNLFSATAKSLYWGGQVVPHIAIGYDANFSWGTLEPFFSVDCSMLFQRSFSEHGAYPLNLHQESSFSQLLRGEMGLHAYEVWSTSIGDFVLRETLSFVNKQPFDVGRINAYLVGYPPGFSVESFTQNQSLFSPSLQFFYRSRYGGFSSLSYVGEFQLGAGSYRSNRVLAKIGMYF